MKNLFVWIVLISTAALGVAVAQPNGELYVTVPTKSDYSRQV